MCGYIGKFDSTVIRHILVTSLFNPCSLSHMQDEPAEFNMPTKPDVKLFTAEGVIDTHNNMEVDTNTKQIVSSTRADKPH